MSTKICSRCDIEKDHSEFNKQSANADGKHRWCRQCQSEYFQEYSQREKDIPGHKTCSNCDVEKPSGDFYEAKGSADGLMYICIECAKAQPHWREIDPEGYQEWWEEYYEENKEHLYKQKVRWERNNKDRVNARLAKRRARKENSTFDDEYDDAIGDFYAQAQWLTNVTGVQHEVDHIDPLVHDKVCGLHVPWNLQVVEADYNRHKNNKFSNPHGNKPISDVYGYA